MTVPAENNIEVSLARMEGKIDLLRQADDNMKEDLKLLRNNVHDFANYIHLLQQLNLPDRLNVIDSRLQRHSERLDRHDQESYQRKGAMNTLKVLWAGVGAAFAAGLGAAIKFLG